jgi:hypothetical protein
MFSNIITTIKSNVAVTAIVASGLTGVAGVTTYTLTRPIKATTDNTVSQEQVNKDKENQDKRDDSQDKKIDETSSQIAQLQTQTSSISSSVNTVVERVVVVEKQVASSSKSSSSVASSTPVVVIPAPVTPPANSSSSSAPTPVIDTTSDTEKEAFLNKINDLKNPDHQYYTLMEGKKEADKEYYIFLNIKSQWCRLIIVREIVENKVNNTYFGRCRDLNFQGWSFPDQQLFDENWKMNNQYKMDKNDFYKLLLANGNAV